MKHRLKRIKTEETLDSVFNRLTSTPSSDIDDIELEVAENDAVRIELAQYGDLTIRGIRLNIKAVMVISIISAILIYLLFGLPNLTKDVSAEVIPAFREAQTIISETTQQ